MAQHLIQLLCAICVMSPFLLSARGAPACVCELKVEIVNTGDIKVRDCTNPSDFTRTYCSGTCERMDLVCQPNFATDEEVALDRPNGRPGDPLLIPVIHSCQCAPIQTSGDDESTCTLIHHTWPAKSDIRSIEGMECFNSAAYKQNLCRGTCDGKTVCKSTYETAMVPFQCTPIHQEDGDVQGIVQLDQTVLSAVRCDCCAHGSLDQNVKRKS